MTKAERMEMVLRRYLTGEDVRPLMELLRIADCLPSGFDEFLESNGLDPEFALAMFKALSGWMGETKQRERAKKLIEAAIQAELDAWFTEKDRLFRERFPERF